MSGTESKSSNSDRDLSERLKQVVADVNRAEHEADLYGDIEGDIHLVAASHVNQYPRDGTREYEHKIKDEQIASVAANPRRMARYADCNKRQNHHDADYKSCGSPKLIPP